MNELFDDIGKKLPYDESEKYLDSLIDEMTEVAIMRHYKSKRKNRLSMIVFSAAASVLLIIGIGYTMLQKSGKTTAPVTLNGEGPIDEFLSTLTDEEVAQLPYYEIEEIPEY